MQVDKQVVLKNCVINKNLIGCGKKGYTGFGSVVLV